MIISSLSRLLYDLCITLMLNECDRVECLRCVLQVRLETVDLGNRIETQFNSIITAEDITMDVYERTF